MEIFRVKDLMGRESWEERPLPEPPQRPGEFEEWVSEPRREN